jgi:hypothetical protein
MGREGWDVAGFGLVRRSPGLAGLLAAQTISPLGDAMATTGLILHVQRTTGSATAVGLLLFAQAIPSLAGVIADRFSPGRLAARAQLSLATTSELVSDLQQLGYLERRRQAGQAHLPHPRGRQALADAGDRVAQIEQHWSQIVGPERFAATCRTLQELLDTLTSNNGT